MPGNGSTVTSIHFQNTLSDMVDEVVCVRVSNSSLEFRKESLQKCENRRLQNQWKF